MELNPRALASGDDHKTHSLKGEQSPPYCRSSHAEVLHEFALRGKEVAKPELPVLDHFFEPLHHLFIEFATAYDRICSHFHPNTPEGQRAKPL